jgi:AraC-like DNA-binding protein
MIVRIECFNSPSLDFDIDLCYCGREDCVPDFACGPYLRNDYLVHYIIKGQGYYIANDIRYEIKEGDIFAIFPGEVTYYATYAENPWSFCWFAFNGKKSVELLWGAGIDYSTPVRHIRPECSITELINSCIELLSDDSSIHRTRLRGYLYLIISSLQESFLKTEKKENTRSKSTEYIEAAIAYIEYNYIKAISVQDIASYIGLERTYFSKLFHSSLGMPPQDYLIKYRMEKACHLIKTTTLNCNQICRYVGINDEFYFSKLFKRVMGISPKEFRASTLVQYSPRKILNTTRIGAE